VRLRAEGKIAHVGLSNVRVKEIEEARAIVRIVSVQNRWNPLTVSRSGVLACCENLGLAFLPYSPFGDPSGARSLTSIGTPDERRRSETFRHTASSSRGCSPRGRP
jgi:aryl-alcohol dehydrogenase-like predicted oxidoreductase